jgi:hypothetical protein
VALPEITDVVHFQPGGCRQNDVGQLGRGGDKEIGYGHEIDFLEGAVDLPGVGAGQDGV